VTSAAQAAWLAERIRAALESSPATTDGGVELRVTASFGVAVLQPDDREPEQLIDRADRALYAAKRGGRNRIVMDERSVAVNGST
jgi:diguanylate cyclase (GGDEF)-like protein